MMFFHIIIAVLFGCLFGIITGLTPGIHINLVSILLVSISGYFLGFLHPIVLGVFIIAMGITHTFIDSIPSIFLGAPDSDMVLSVLPGHRLLLQGQGFEAVKLTVIGSLFCLIAIIALIPILLPFLPVMYDFVQPYIGYLLIIIVVFMILKERGLIKKFWGFFVFMIAGILGLIVLNYPNLRQPLFPMLSGLFGISTLIMSLFQKVSLPEQRVTEMIKIPFKDKFKAISGATITGAMAGFLPGLGSAQSAIIAMQFIGRIGMYSFLILVGGINTVNFVFSIATFYAINKARNGAIVAIMEILQSIDINGVVIFLAAALIAGGIATFLALKLAKVFSKFITKVNYKHLCIGVIAFVSLLVWYFSSFIGLFVLFVSTAIGLIAPLMGVKRSLSMGCLLLPVILFFIL